MKQSERDAICLEWGRQFAAMARAYLDRAEDVGMDVGQLLSTPFYQIDFTLSLLEEAKKEGAK